jgi:hypothetical protein
VDHIGDYNENSVKLQNEVQEMYPFFVSMKYPFPLHEEKLGSITFQHVFHYIAGSFHIKIFMTTSDSNKILQASSVSLESEIYEI